MWFICGDHILSQVEDDLDKVKNASSQSELMEFFRNFGVNTVELIQQAARRQAVRTRNQQCVVVGHNTILLLL